MGNIAQLKYYAILPERLETTLHKKNVPFNISGLCNVGPIQCCPRGSKQHCTGKKSGNSGHVVWTTSGHSLDICIYQVHHVKKYKVMLSLLWKSAETNAEASARIFNPATDQTFSRTLSTEVKLSVSHAMLTGKELYDPTPNKKWLSKKAQMIGMTLKKIL